MPPTASSPGYSEYDLRYAEVYSADDAKIGCLATLQDYRTGRIRVDVGGFLTVQPASLTLSLPQVEFRRDHDLVVFLRSSASKAALMALLSPHTAASEARAGWWCSPNWRQIYSRR